MRRPIDLLASTSKSTKTISGHENAVRQMIAHEIEASRIRGHQTIHLPDQGAQPNRATLQLSSRSAELQRAYADILTTKTLSAPTIEKTTVKRDFFGRPIVKPPNPVGIVELDESKQDIPAPKIWYKYNEGFTNAIKRTIRIQDLFHQ